MPPALRRMFGPGPLTSKEGDPIVRTVCAVILLAVSATCASAQDCSVYLSKGIYDTHSSSDELATSSSYLQWFCDNKFAAAKDADEYGATLGFPFKGIPVKLGFDQKSESYSSWQSNFCSSAQTNQTLLSKARDILKTINPGIVDAVNKCLESDGLHLWLERTGDPKTFLFVGRYNSPFPEAFPNTKISTFDPGPNVKCAEKPTAIGKAEWRTRCSREDNLGVAVVVNATPGPIVGGGYLSLSPLPDPSQCASEYKVQPYTTQDDGRRSKSLSCPQGKTVIAGSARCLRTSDAFGGLKSSEQVGDNTWVCEWDPQPIGVGLWIELGCKCK